jgi:hypothetical protein
LKFVIRRLVVGLVALPLVAGLYVVGYGIGIGLTGSGASLSEAWANGLMIGLVVAIAFAGATQLDKFVSKIVGEN